MSWCQINESNSNGFIQHYRNLENGRLSRERKDREGGRPDARQDLRQKRGRHDESEEEKGELGIIMSDRKKKTLLVGLLLFFFFTLSMDLNTFKSLFQLFHVFC